MKEVKNKATVFAWRTVTNYFSLALLRNVCFAFPFTRKLEIHQVAGKIVILNILDCIAVCSAVKNVSLFVWVLWQIAPPPNSQHWFNEKSYRVQTNIACFFNCVQMFTLCKGLNSCLCILSFKHISAIWKIRIENLTSILSNTSLSYTRSTATT